MAPTAPRRRSFPIAALLALVVVSGLASAAPVGARAVERGGTGCFQPDAPRSFHRQLVAAIRISGDLPREWARSPFIAKIVCWQGSGFDPEFRDRGRANAVWHGIFAMTTDEVDTIFGPWMTANRFAFRLSHACFVHGWEACPNRTANAAVIQQMIAGLRWIWLNYGNPTAAWGHITRTGRFNSYPRPGTVDEPTRDPFRRCPVAGGVSYRDDFGERRTVGGYHPHWGNDVIAPIGRPIRAPFDGFAVAHHDGWFAGLWVTVVGEEGYVRNDHLRRVVRTGPVKAGAVVGFVGETGDARGPHDHFEWHPWSVELPLHRSPFGFRRVMDAIDPYPFLNKACGPRRIPLPPRVTQRPLEG